MYFPFLRARQFELIALREFVVQEDNGFQITPIFEPVKDNLKGLKRAVPMFQAAENKFAIVMNSDLSPGLDTSEILAQLNPELTARETWIPAFHVNTNYDWISREVTQIDSDEVILICSESVDTSNEQFISLLEIPKVTFILSRENRGLSRIGNRLNKQLIRWDDNFNKLRKNGDYLDQPEEKFTEEHLYYRGDGNYGFSDYGPLGSEFVDGGSMPYAVAIHLTYLKPNNEIWIKHFTSISNEDQADVQGKFAQAAKKAVNFLDEMNIQTEASIELRRYFNQKKFPGLGVVKKISLRHHVELINSIIQ